MRKYVVEVRQWVRQTNPGEEWSRRSMRKIYVLIPSHLFTKNLSVFSFSPGDSNPLQKMTK